MPPVTPRATVAAPGAQLRSAADNAWDVRHCRDRATSIPFLHDRYLPAPEQGRDRRCRLRRRDPGLRHPDPRGCERCGPLRPGHRQGGGRGARPAARPAVPPADVYGSDDVAICEGADVIAVTAGAKQRPGQTRLELAGVNVDICRALIPQLLDVAPDAVIVMVTNPVDVLTLAALKFSGLPKNRVLGSGTVLDSARLRQVIARQLGVASQSVHAFIAGEHGDSEFPLWSSASIGTVPVLEFVAPGGDRLDEDQEA